MGRGKIPPKSVQLSPPYISVNMEKPTKQQHIPPCECGEMSAEIKSMVECKHVAKAPVAEVDGYDKVY